MEFIIERKEEKKSRDYFEVEIKTIIGDANGSDFLSIGRFFNDNEYTKGVMVDLVETLDRMKEKFPNGKGGNDSYGNVEGFQRWFRGIADEVYENTDPSVQDFYEEYDWPCDIYGNHNLLHSYSISYYDDNGKKHKVTVKSK